MLYALTREGGSVLAINGVTGRELRTMQLGRAPSLALVAP